MQENEPQTSKAMGKIMSFLAWLSFMVLATLLMDKWIKHRYAHLPVNQNITEYNGQKMTIIQRNIGNHYLAYGSINQEEVLFLLDTGATEVVIPGALAKTLGLSKGKAITARTAAGNIDIYRTTIDKLSIGHITLENVTASINPKMEGHEVLLGMNVLNQINFRQQDGTLILTERTSKPRSR